MHARSNGSKLPLETTIKDNKDKDNERVAVGLANANEISMDAAPEAGLWEPDGMFALKEAQEPTDFLSG